MKNNDSDKDLTPIYMKGGLLVFWQEMFWMHFYESQLDFSSINKFFHVLIVIIVGTN